MGYRKPSLKIAAAAAVIIMSFNAAVAPLCLSWVGQTQRDRQLVEDQLTSLRGLLELVVDAETGQRGYIITGDDRFLQPYYATMTNLPEGLRTLEALYATDPEQEQQAVQGIRALVDEKMANLAETIKLRRDKGYDAAMQVVMQGVGKGLTDRIRESIATQVKGEMDEVVQLDQQLVQKALLAVAFSLSGTLLTLVLLTWLFLRMREAIRQTENSALEASQESSRVEAGMVLLRKRNREISLLGEMSQLLQTEMTLAEGLKVTAEYCNHLLAGTAGSVYLYSQAADLFELAGEWGDGQPASPTIIPHECWGLRRGNAHHGVLGQPLICCEHYSPLDPASERNQSNLCLPLIAYGEVMGMFYIRKLAEAGSQEAFSETQMEIAKSISEQVALALSNVKLRNALHDKSIRDPLTGLFNRRYMEETLNREMARAQRMESPLSVVMLDLDHFKQINDMHGHAVGDAVLRSVANLLKQSLRTSDVACRYGGEELMLILPNCTSEHAVQKAQQLCDSVRALIITEAGKAISVTASFGVASTGIGHFDAAELVGMADKALYQAKETGRDRVVLQACRPEATASPVHPQVP
ncbi:diguanylate cyclase [Pseudomonas sp. 21TX0197]|uniref:diguanylate cyclase n=1 Tax=unclassified Pseudomonas TaxID=196821 RepID=UPI00092255BB|nr:MULTISPECIES: diguanylate cyclase [unclassified Pseudomonas]MDB6441989.1 diguanylate cyclase [Pseudomonas sp. 21TX0197]SFX39250.1 diguanylate cyclase (GGDEF) domain-containing protein [Pseudomonas sp. NFACC36]